MILVNNYDWKQLPENKKRIIYVIIYSIAFLIALAMVYSPFLLGGKTMILEGDGTNQHYPLMVYIGRHIRQVIRSFFHGKLSVHLFDLSISLGDDAIGFVNSMGGTDPMMLLSGLIPTKYSEYLYAFLSVFRIYLAGLSFSYLCFYLKKRKSYTLLGSLVYDFCGYAIHCAVRHPYFVTPMRLMPVLIVGTDKILKKEHPYIFIFTVCYSALCGYYHLYMMTIMTGMYAFVRFFDYYKTKRIKEFIILVGRGIGDYCLGIGISAVVFFPAVMEFFNSARSGSSLYSPIIHTWAWFRGHIWRLIAPSASSGWSYPAFAAIAIMALVFLFMYKGNRTLKILTIVTFGFYYTGMGNFIMNGFQYPSARWSFGVSLVVAFVVVGMSEEIFTSSLKQQILCLGVVIIYSVVAFSTAGGRRLTYVLVGVSFLALTWGTLMFVIQNGKSSKWSLNVQKNIRIVLCLVVVIANVGVNGIYLFASDQGNVISRYRNLGVELDMLSKRAERELEPYLSDNPQGRADSTIFTVNAGMSWDIPTMLTYSSVSSKYIGRYMKELEYCGNGTLFGIPSTDQRTIGNTLWAGKYHLESEDKSAYVPYGYTLIEKTKTGNMIYENDYALPWGYTYDAIVSYDDLMSLNGIEKQELMLQAIALETKSMEKTSSSIQFDSYTVPYNYECKDCTWRNDELIVSKANATITLDFDMPEEVEGYVRLNDFDINNSGLTTFDIRVNCGEIIRTSTVSSNLWGFYFGRKNYSFNLGYDEKERTSCTITFPVKGTFKLKDIEVIILPMSNYRDRILALRAEPLENVVVDANRIVGTLNLSSDKILCLSIPYSRGWTATVDGQQTKIQCGNYMFMAIPVSAGFHDIQFIYCSPGLKLGAVVTFISLLFIFVMYLRGKKHIK